MSANLPAPRRCALATAIAVAISAPAAQAQQAQKPKKAIEEVIVTATKREESMQDVPVAITALQTDALEELRIGTFQDYVMFLPNVVAQGTGPGQNELFIRGAATSQTVLTLSSVQGLQPSVALYLDEQPVAMQGRNLDIYATDLKRVEVLPGPQGTLFGASSQAGTVRLITNEPDHTEFQAGFDVSYSTTSGGEASNSVEAYLNVPISESFAVRIAAYNDRQGGWIDNVLNDPANGGWNGSAVVIDRISGGPLPDPENQTIPAPRNDQFVERDFNDATYAGVRAGASFFINDNWDLLVQHTQQSLDTEGVWAYDANLPGDSSVNRFAPDNNEDDFGLTTWTLEGRLAMLDVVYTGGYLSRDVNSSVDYTWYTNGGLFSAYYVCYPGNGTYDQCFDPQKFYQEDTENTRTTHEFRVVTPSSNRWRATAGVFYDDQELASTGLFKIASTASPYFQDLSRTLVGGSGTPGTRTGGGPFPSEISFVNDVTRTTEQLAVFGQFEYDLTERMTVALGARWYDIDDEYKGATTTVNVTNQLAALGDGSLSALQDHFGAGQGQAVFDAIEIGQLDVSDLNGNGVLNQSDTIVRVSLDYALNNDVLLFGTYSQGFRPPVTNRVGATAANVQSGPFEGFRVPVSSSTDDLDNYELGVKADFLGNTLRLNATYFWSEITDLQTSRFDPTNISFLWFADNVGDAEIAGIDADFIWLPSEKLTLSGAFSVLDTEITRLNDELVGIAAPVGSELPFAADFSANVRARYDFDIDSIEGLPGLMGYWTAAVAYTGESVAGVKMDAYVAEDTLQRVYQVSGSGLEIRREADAFLGAAAGTELLNETGVPGGRFVQGGYTIANLAFGVAKDGWLAELFIDNVTDEGGEVYVDTQNFTPKVVTNRPRTIGLRLSYDF
jgi:outer membrane receptor protein involved in Fe transport